MINRNAALLIILFILLMSAMTYYMAASTDTKNGFGEEDAIQIVKKRLAWHAEQHLEYFNQDVCMPSGMKCSPTQEDIERVVSEWERGAWKAWHHEGDKWMVQCFNESSGQSSYQCIQWTVHETAGMAVLHREPC